MLLPLLNSLALLARPFAFSSSLEHCTDFVRRTSRLSFEVLSRHVLSLSHSPRVPHRSPATSFVTLPVPWTIIIFVVDRISMANFIDTSWIRESILSPWWMIEGGLLVRHRSAEISRSSPSKHNNLRFIFSDLFNALLSSHWCSVFEERFHSIVCLEKAE